LFADGFHCPYAPASGKGLPEAELEGTATNGTSTVLYGNDHFENAGVASGWQAFVESKKIVGVVNHVSGQTLHVNEWLYSGASTALTPANTDRYIVGSEASGCNYSLENCMALGMFGPTGWLSVSISGSSPPA
jgi:hypothetical protein